MVEEQLRRRGIADPRVLAAMESVPREAFVPETMRELAFADGPLPIGSGQTISQPYVVAAMTEALSPRPGRKILEVGTGSGYQAAVLAETGVSLFTVEYIEELAVRAREILESIDYRDIHFRVGDGHDGWPEEAPFDGILVTAAPREVPPALIDQLRVGGRLVIPVGHHEQELRLYRKEPDGTTPFEILFAVRFVPLV
jgi:protein-L-isoaspartate(D-aspartate) O-methyltransferase